MTTISDLEKQIEECRETIAVRDMALKLYENKEFKAVIIDDFSTKQCALYAQLSCDPSLTKEQQQDALGLAQAAGHLRRFLSAKVAMGNQAARTIADIEEEIEAVRLEGGDE